MHKYWRERGRPPTPHVKIFICEPCNRYFNSMLENPCRDQLKQMMRMESVALDSAMQGLLTAYITKFWLLMAMWPHESSTQDPFITTQDMHAFRQGLTLPPGTRIWLGSIENANPEREEEVTRAIPEILEPLEPQTRWLMPVGSSCHLMSLEHMFAVVFWLRPDPHGFQATIDARVMIRKAEQAGLVRKIWPAREAGVHWPPPMSFETKTYAYFAAKFGYVPPGLRPTINHTSIHHSAVPPELLDFADRWAALPPNALAAETEEGAS
jgi:hypothetical protein